ncbi:unnamed protein product [Bathycoccus prasinos]
MLISKANRNEVYKYLFKEGVVYAKKDYSLPQHPDIPVPNLQVIKLMQSFKSKEYVKEIFSWQYYYYYLTNEGIEYLREYLNLGPDVVPDTLKKSARPAGGKTGRRRLGSGGGGVRRFGGRGGGRGGDREGYRSERPAFGRGG